jgi:hypothetical protein
MDCATAQNSPIQRRNWERPHAESAFPLRHLRTSAYRKAHLIRARPVVADQRPIVRSEPVIALETTEFDSDGIADDRQRVKPTLCCRPRVSAFGKSNTPRSFMSSAKLTTRAAGVEASCLLKCVCTSAYFCLSANTLVGFLYRKGIVCHRVVPSLCASHGSPSGQVPVPSHCRPVASSGRIRGSVKPGKLRDK